MTRRPVKWHPRIKAALLAKLDYFEANNSKQPRETIRTQAELREESVNQQVERLAYNVVLFVGLLGLR